MADAVQEQVENALNLVVTTTEQSGNMKKALKVLHAARPTR